MSQKIAVVGVGFLGSELMTALRLRGENPCSIDPAAPADFACRATELPTYLTPQAFRLIFCCQATHGGDVSAYRSVYLDSVRALHQRFPAARLIFCSSTSVYRTASGEKADENAPTRTDSPRAEILLNTESEVLALGGIVARLAPLYGKGRCELLRRHLAGEARLPGPSNRVLNYLHRDDAVSALLRLAERGQKASVCNVCSESLTHAEAYRLLETCTGRAASATYSPPSQRGTGDTTILCPRLRALGWTPRHTLAEFFTASLHAS